MPERVLTVESDPGSILLLEACLCSAGYGISFVRDGSDAAAEARRQRPDIIGRRSFTLRTRTRRM